MLKKKSLFIVSTVLMLTSLFGLAMAEGADFSGNWQGTWTSSYHENSGGRLDASITQVGSDLYGTLDVRGDTDCGDFLGETLTGTVSGNTATFQISEVSCPSDGSENDLEFEDAVLSGDSMEGYYYLYDYIEGYVDEGTFTLARYPLVSRFRLYNPNTYHHLYTTNPNEYDYLGTIGWIQEGTSCKLYDGFHSIGAVVTVPYYRLYNPNSFEHHWTTDANEYNVLGARGWSQEGVDGYVFGSPVSGSAPLYRLYNPTDGLHLWTMDTNERSVLIGRGFVDEGIACYVFP